MFVDYLKENFPDINDFNHEFGLDYWSNRVNDWDDFPDVRGTINQSLAAEFCKFQRSLVTKFLSWQADIVRSTNGMISLSHKILILTGPHTRSVISPRSTSTMPHCCMTVAGADIYHPSNEELTGAEITVCGNISRSLKKDNYLILETEALGTDSVASLSGTAPPAGIQPYRKRLKQCDDVLALAFDPQCN